MSESRPPLMDRAPICADESAHVAADLGPLLRLPRGGPHGLHLVAPGLEVGGDRVGERGPLVGAERDSHDGNDSTSTART